MASEHNTALLNAYLDGELDAVRAVEVEEHLKLCGDCSAELAGYRAMREGLRSGALYDRAPLGLRSRILIAGGTSGGTAHRETATARPARPWWTALAAAALLLVALVGWRALADRNSRNIVAQEVVASHIRSLQPGHLYDVQSTDQHTVKPWFAGKLDFSPPVNDFANQGFPLVGGRLDYFDGRPVAALVYQRQKHIINIFVWRPDSANGTETQRRLQGYSTVFWERDGMEFAAVSDLNAAELRTLVDLLKQ